MDKHNDNKDVLLQLAKLPKVLVDLDEYLADEPAVRLKLGDAPKRLWDAAKTVLEALAADRVIRVPFGKPGEQPVVEVGGEVSRARLEDISGAYDDLLDRCSELPARQREHLRARLRQIDDAIRPLMSDTGIFAWER